MPLKLSEIDMKKIWANFRWWLFQKSWLRLEWGDFSICDWPPSPMELRIGLWVRPIRCGAGLAYRTTFYSQGTIMHMIAGWDYKIPVRRPALVLQWAWRLQPAYLVKEKVIWEGK